MESLAKPPSLFRMVQSLTPYDLPFPGASIPITPYKRWSKCTMEKVRGRFLQPFFRNLRGEDKMFIAALISSAN